jgi:predicted MFS family arabinose efflux permease
VLLHNQSSAHRPKLDLPGVLTVSSGLFAVVYGFSHAETGGWANSVTIGFLVAGAALLATFVYLQTRVAHPLLPLRVVLDRNRGGAYLAIFALGAGMFGVFLFLTYYLQQTLGFSAVQSGLAFLPMTVTLVIVSQIGTLVLAPRVGPRFIIAPGLALAAAGMLMLTRLDLSSDYASGVLPALVVFAAGLGLTFSSAMSTATYGVDHEDAGVASAMVNTGQQVGGSIGTALLNTLAASAATSYVGSHAAGPDLVAQATMHSYTTAFGWSAGILATGAVICAVLLRPRVLAVNPQAAEVVAL